MPMASVGRCGATPSAAIASRAVARRAGSAAGRDEHPAEVDHADAHGILAPAPFGQQAAGGDVVDITAVQRVDEDVSVKQPPDR
jgi:hypothetical protein